MVSMQSKPSLEKHQQVDNRFETFYIVRTATMVHMQRQIASWRTAVRERKTQVGQL
jgi:hypothetical protein